MTRSLDPKKIKSAQRVLEVLRYFNGNREEATVMDVARAMGYPQSSTSELLGCLVALGYLHRDRSARTYRPTARVALLGAWVQPKLFRRGRLLPMIDALADETGTTVFLAAKIGLSIQYIHVVPAPGTTASPLCEGDTAPLLSSAVGKTLLSTQDRELARKLVHRLNAEAEDSTSRISFTVYSEDLDRVRTQGYAVTLDEANGGIVSMLLPRTNTDATADERLVMGVHGASDFIELRHEELVQMMRDAIMRHLRPVRLVASSPVRRQAQSHSQMELAHAV